MKAMKYMLALALILGLVSCQPEMFNGKGSISDADLVEVTFSVQLPEPMPVSTKASMGEGPTADEFEIHLCIYGPGDGFVQNWVEATNVTTATNAAGYVTGGTFKALIPVADDQRTIHVIANPPAAVTPTTTDYIDNVMEKMTNGQDSCAYWQQIILPEIKPENGSTTNPPQASTAVQTAFRNIHLLRNFAKIKVTSPEPTDADYESIIVKRWTLINVPTRGYVAPYTGIKTNRFPSGYLNAFLQGNPTGSQLYTQLIETDQYPGYMPTEAVIDETFPGNPDQAAAKYKERGQALYMYERPLPTSDQLQTAILMEVEFLSGHALYDNEHPDSEHNTYWYKIEVLDNHGAYVPFLRNIVYTLRIMGLEDTGEATALDAFNGPYFGNISASLETAGLSDLSNGTSAIHVDQLDYTFMTIPDIGTILLSNPDGTASVFFFTPDVEHADQTYFQDETGVCEVSVTKMVAGGYAPAVANFTISDGGNRAGTITITPSTIGTTMKKSILRVQGQALPDGKVLYRDITITLMPKPDLKNGEGDDVVWTAILDTPEGITGVNHPVRLKVCLPEGLGSSIFPIQLRIEAENNTLSATSPDLPVSTGKSVFDPTRNTYFFIYTINYSDYCSLNPRTKKYEYKYIFGVKDDDSDRIILKTSKPGDNSTKIDIRDMKDNFNPVELTLGNP